MSKSVEKLLETGIPLDRFSYVWQPIYCQKPTCKRCPHGPYLYARWREGTRVRAIYIGSIVPPELKPYVPSVPIK